MVKRGKSGEKEHQKEKVSRQGDNPKAKRKDYKKRKISSEKKFYLGARCESMEN